MKIDWKLKGWNLLKFACNKSTILHPETCSDVVLMGHEGEKTLTEWIKGTGSSIGNSLSDWIINQFPNKIDVNITWHPNTDLDQSNALSLGYIGTNSSNLIKVPYSNSIGVNNPTFGLICAGSTVEVDEGVLNVKAATTNTLGGIRLGTPPQTITTTRPVLMDVSGPAYVDLSNINANVCLNNWQIVKDEVGTKVASTFWINPEEYNNSDPKDWEGDTLVDVLTTPEYYNLIKDKYDGVPSIEEVVYKIYPIRADKAGRLYTYVDWENTIYSNFSTSVAGLVPASGVNTTKFLRGDGAWEIPTDTTYPVLSAAAHASGTLYTVEGSGYSGAPSKYLREDGNWAVPVEYNVSDAQTENEKGGTLVTTRDLEVEFTIASSQRQPTLTNREILVPIVYGKKLDTNYHGIELGVLVDAIINDNDLLSALKTALGL